MTTWKKKKKKSAKNETGVILGLLIKRIENSETDFAHELLLKHKLQKLCKALADNLPAEVKLSKTKYPHCWLVYN